MIAGEFLLGSGSWSRSQRAEGDGEEAVSETQARLAIVEDHPGAEALSGRPRASGVGREIRTHDKHRRAGAEPR